MAEPIKKTKPKPLALTLSTTEFDRQSIDIDGVLYEMRSDDELSVPMMRQFRKLAKDADPEDDDEIGTKAEQIYDAVQVVMVDLPMGVQDKLGIRQQSKIIEAFAQLVADDNAASE